MGNKVLPNHDDALTSIVVVGNEQSEEVPRNCAFSVDK